MKANKKTLLAFRKMMENEQEAYDYEGLIEQAVEDTKLLKSHEMGDYTLATDECGIVWCDQDVCVLAEFVDEYSRIFLEYGRVNDWRRH